MWVVLLDGRVCRIDGEGRVELQVDEDVRLKPCGKGRVLERRRRS